MLRSFHSTFGRYFLTKDLTYFPNGAWRAVTGDARLLIRSASPALTYGVEGEGRHTSGDGFRAQTSPLLPPTTR